MNIRYGILIMTLAGGIASANAQEIKKQVEMMPENTISAHETIMEPAAPNLTAEPIEPTATIDSLALPRLNYLGQVQPPLYRWYGMYPMYCGMGWSNWELHKGLNVSMGASVFAQFGKHARHGAGFNQNIAAMYAMPLSKNLSLAVGGYFNNTYWGHDTYRDAGLSAVLGYRFNEHWEAYIYGQKSIASSNYIPYSLYDMNALGDRIGAAVKYNVNKNFSITLSVDKQFAPDNGWWPVPPVSNGSPNIR